MWFRSLICYNSHSQTWNSHTAEAVSHPPTLGKEDMPIVVTYSDLFLFGAFVVSVIELMMNVKKK